MLNEKGKRGKWGSDERECGKGAVWRNQWVCRQQFFTESVISLTFFGRIRKRIFDGVNVPFPFACSFPTCYIARLATLLSFSFPPLLPLSLSWCLDALKCFEEKRVSEWERMHFLMARCGGSGDEVLFVSFFFVMMIQNLIFTNERYI